MVFQFHRDAGQQFEQQRLVTANAVIPFIEGSIAVSEGQPVLEIGCGEGGVLKSFVERGCIGTGVEIDEQRYMRAEYLLQEEIRQGRVRLLRKDICDVEIEKELEGRFQLIVLKDVIEHIPDQARLLRRLRNFLLPDGAVFLSFPPWEMPFGGHQQICTSKVLSVTPYVHLLPNWLYRNVLKLAGEPDTKIEQLLAVKRMGLSLEKFERFVEQAGYGIINRTLFLVNPVYLYKFGLEPRRQFRLIARLPYIRNFLTTCGYYLIKPKEH